MLGERRLAEHLPSDVVAADEVPTMDGALAARMHGEVGGAHGPAGEEHLTRVRCELIEGQCEPPCVRDELFSQMSVGECSVRRLAFVVSAGRSLWRASKVRLDQFGFLGCACCQVRDEFVCGPSSTVRQPGRGRRPQRGDELADLVNGRVGLADDLGLKRWCHATSITRRSRRIRTTTRQPAHANRTIANAWVPAFGDTPEALFWDAEYGTPVARSVKPEVSQYHARAGNLARWIRVRLGSCSEGMARASQCSTGAKCPRGGTSTTHEDARAIPWTQSMSRVSPGRQWCWKSERGREN